MGPFNEIRLTDQLLGKGGFGSVWLGLGDTGEQVAVKRVRPKGKTFEGDVKKAQKEYEILKSLDHENIVKVHELSIAKEGDEPVIDIVLEYVAGGSVKDLLKNFGPLPELATQNYTREILSGLEYLHDHGILHMDIKPSNVMVTTTGVIKITDFGLSREALLCNTTSGGAPCGTYPFMSPALVAEGLNSRQSDVWAVGCSVLEMCTGKGPWSERNLQEQQYIFVIGNAHVTGDVPGVQGDVSEVLKKFLTACWGAERDQVECRDLLQHPFLTSDEDINSTKSNMVIRKAVEKPSSDVTVPKPQVVTTTAITTQLISRVEQPCGDLFRMDEELPWDVLWHRIGQGSDFKGTAFTVNYNYLFPLVKYLMCYASGQAVELVSYVDDYLPFIKYFKGDAGKMIHDVAELNKRMLFEINASTGSTEKTLFNAEKGSMLIRPSKSNRGTLALSVRGTSQQTNTLVTKHYFILPSGNGLAVSGLTGSPIAPSLYDLVTNLTAKFPSEFTKGAGRCEIPKITHSVYSMPE